MKIKIKLRGLCCNGCLSVVKAALKDAGAVVEDLSFDEAVVEFDGDANKLVDVIKEVGYEAELVE